METTRQIRGPPQNVVNNHWVPSTVPQAYQLSKAFDEKVEACRSEVRRIVEEHKRLNQIYRDLDFDIDTDFKSGKGRCLKHLLNQFCPQIWKRRPGSKRKKRRISVFAYKRKS